MSLIPANSRLFLRLTATTFAWDAKPGNFVHLTLMNRLTKSAREYLNAKSPQVSESCGHHSRLRHTCPGNFGNQPSRRYRLCPAASPPGRHARPQDNQQDQDKDNQDQSVSTLKVNVNVVQLFFNVKDKKGALIPNLAKDDFQIFEDGKPQTIKYFTAESDLPLTLGILIDSSGSQQRVLEMEKEVGGNFLSEILRPKDMAFVISFDVDSNLLQDFTNSSRGCGTP